MTESNHKDFFSLIPDGRRYVDYTGAFDNPIMESLVDQMKGSLRDLKLPFRITKGLYSIAVESIENIVKHGAVTGEDEKVGRFLFGKDPSGDYSLIIQNDIGNFEMIRLKNRLEELKNLDVESLRSLYRHELINGKVSEKGGAGLGIYIMALRCQNAIRYDIKGIENGKYRYTIYISLGQ